jgi:predicted enzyme related to lactoylglutathione lyase
MAERDGFIPGVPCWVDTSQPDPDAAAAFYSGLFGWEVEDVMPPGAQGKYLTGRLRGRDVGAISSQQPDGPSTPVWNTYIQVDSAEDTAAKVRDAGGRVLMEPMDVMDAGRMAVFADPEGAVVSVWQPGRHRGSGVVNEHGAVVFNDLNTRDPEGAKDFYGYVFGWRTLSLGDAELWRLPGYGDHLEKGDPQLRERMADVGAPEGFEDVVASLNVIGPDRPDVPAHWGVTFATDDADATAARAAELGGTVLAAPFDAPWVRMTVLADPQGATFVASQFVPGNREIAPADSAASAA